GQFRGAAYGGGREGAGSKSITQTAPFILNGKPMNVYFLPECDSERAKSALADVMLKEHKLEPTRYEPITTVSSSETLVMCKATLLLPDGSNAAIDYSFFWQGSQANIRYSIQMPTAPAASSAPASAPAPDVRAGSPAHGANTEKRLCHALDGSTAPCPCQRQ